MSARDAARVLEVSVQTVREMAHRGELAAMGVRVLRMGREGSRKPTLRISTSDLRRAVGADDATGKTE